MQPTKTLPLLLAAILAAPASAAAQVAEDVRAARTRLTHEPTASETARRALTYFRVHPEALDGLRDSARSRALLPVVAAGYQYGQNRAALFYDQMITNPQTRDQNTAESTHRVTAGALWDLRQLGFNPAEVEVYGLVSVQRDLLLEITRAYFLRRQLQLRLALRPPEDPLAYVALELRVSEFTTILDVLTGGWFSDTAEERRVAQTESRQPRR